MKREKRDWKQNWILWHCFNPTSHWSLSPFNWYVFLVCNGTSLLQYNLFLLPSSIAASANHHDYSICSFIINFLLQNTICSSPYRADKHFTTQVGHEANCKVGFLQTHATVFLIEMFWNEIMKVERFLISSSLFLYCVYRKDTEGFHFHWTSKRFTYFLKNILLYVLGFFNIVNSILALEDSVD